MLKKLAILSFTFFLFAGTVNSQVTHDLKPEFEKIFKGRPEVCFEFFIKDRQQIQVLTRVISIDNVMGNKVRAYANKKEFAAFLELGIAYTILPVPAMENPAPAQDIKLLKSPQAWDFYPNYPSYESMMFQYATDNPQLCKIETAGTVASGRKLLVAKISANVDSVMHKPQFLWVSSIHGDELTGYVLMLRMIDYLLANYGTNPRITNLLNKAEIYINPLMNPDGTFYGGNNSVNDATRYNAMDVDLNRNFPDPQDGPHPDNNAWQEETVIMMNYASSHHFSMGGNFHGGAEVINYPWDTWAMLHPDDDWWYYVSREYADTVHANATSFYLTDLDDGITNGYAWYQITGGRQDYMTYFHRGREATFEISATKLVAPSTLPNYWNYNYRSLLNYMEHVTFGVHGIVTDSVTGLPLKARVFINGHDHDSSHVWSNLPLGNYYRYLGAGSYNLTYTATGYWPKTVYNLGVVNHQTTIRDVQLVPLSIGIGEINSVKTITASPNPTSSSVLIKSGTNWSGEIAVEVMNPQGQVLKSVKIKGDALVIGHPLVLEGLSKGLLLIRLTNQEKTETLRVLYQ